MIRAPSLKFLVALPAHVIALGVCLVATIYLGVLPGRVLDYAMHGAQDLMK